MYYLLDNKILVKAAVNAKREARCTVTLPNLEKYRILSNRLHKYNNKIIRSLK